MKKGLIMGNIDVIAKSFFRNKHNFADLFNFKLYDGTQVIHAEDLKEQDSMEIVIPYSSNAKAPLQKIRDNIMLFVHPSDAEYPGFLNPPAGSGLHDQPAPARRSEK